MLEVLTIIGTLLGIGKYTARARDGLIVQVWHMRDATLDRHSLSVGAAVIGTRVGVDHSEGRYVYLSA